MLKGSITFNTSVRAGYDATKYKSGELEDYSSAFMQAGIGLTYANTTAPTKWNVGADLSTIYYMDGAETGEDFDYTARVSFNISHEINRRLSVSNNFYLTYETEPDYGIGTTVGRRSGQYIYGYNNTSVAYAWTERVSTATSYSIDGILYTDQDQVGNFEDRINHVFSQQISYALSRTVKLTAEYRFGYTDYTSTPAKVDEEVGNPDAVSHYLLVGVDKAWSERTTGSLRAGAQLYESDRTSSTAPYLEGALNYALSRRSSLRWYAQIGFDGTELGLYDSRYSYRTGVEATYAFTQSLSANVGLHYVHSEAEGGPAVGSSSEDQVNASLGLSYNFWNNLSLDASYSFTTIAADSSFGDYDRHRVSLGLNAVF
ncbi:MAG: outer membrane beta-barrel protein [Verrucomicrobium sp.]